MIEWWKRWWFPSSRGLDLSICRVLVVGAQLFVFLPFFMTTPSQHVALIERGGGFIQPQWIIGAVAAILPVDVVSWPALVRGVYAVMIAAGLTTLIGLRTRTSALVFAMGTWFLVSHAGSYGQIQHTELILAMFLLFLGLSPSGRFLSIDSMRGGRPSEATEEAVWPLKLTQVLLAWGYFSNAVAKLTFAGLEWVNGYTLQQHMLVMSLRWDRPLGLWLAQHHGLCVALSVGTLAFELLFPLALFVRKTRPYFLLGGIVFHVISYLAMNVAFFQHIVLYAVFIDFEGLANRIRQARRLPSRGRLVPRAS